MTSSVKFGSKDNILLTHIAKGNRVVESNFLDWKKENSFRLWQEYGDTAKAFDNYKNHVPKMTMTMMKCLKLAKGRRQIAYKLYTSALLKWQDEKQSEKQKRTKLFASIVLLMSDTALEAVQEHADFAAANERKNPAKLMVVIRDECHLSTLGEDDVEDEKRLRVVKERNNLVMTPTQSLSSYYRAFTNACERIKAAGGALENQYTLSVMFVQGLDPHRWKAYHARILSDKNMGVKKVYPSTLQEAKDIAQGWMGSPEILAIAEPSEEETTATICTDQAFTKLLAKVAELEKNQTKNGNKSSDKGDKQAPRCDCGKGGGKHDPKECWHKYPHKKPAHIKQRDIENAERKRKRDIESAEGKGGKHKKPEYEDNGFMEAITDEEFDAALEEHNDIVHSMVAVWQCEDVHELFTPALDEVIDQKLMATLSSFADEVAAHSLALAAKGQQVENLVGDTTLLLDTGAGRSLVKNQQLLHKMRPASKPVQLRGITGGDQGMRIELEGTASFLGTKQHTVSYHTNANVNVLGWSSLKDDGILIESFEDEDYFIVNKVLRFDRKTLANGEKSKHYTCDVAKLLVVQQTIATQTVADNLRSYTKREVARAIAAKEFQRRLGYASVSSAAAVLRGGAAINVDGVPMTVDNLKIAEQIFGPDVAQLKASTTKRKAKSAAPVVAPRVVQQPQEMYVDKFQVKEISFLVGVTAPMGLIMCTHLKDETAPTTAAGVKLFISKAKSRDFDVTTVHTDPGKELAAMQPTLDQMGSPINIVGPGQHVAVAERAGRTIKERVRGHENGLPYVMCRALIILCVLFCVSMLNFQPRQANLDLISPHEAFTGRKMDSSRDLRFGFGDYVQATMPYTDNSMRGRTQGCIVGVSTGNRTGSVTMMSLSTGELVTRDTFKILPMPDIVIAHLNKLATRDGFARGGTVINNRGQSQEPIDHPVRPRIPVYGRDSNPQQDAASLSNAAGVDLLPDSLVPTPQNSVLHPRRSTRFADQYRLLDEHDEVDESGGEDIGGDDPGHAEFRDDDSSSVGIRGADTGDVEIRGAESSEAELNRGEDPDGDVQESIGGVGGVENDPLPSLSSTAQPRRSSRTTKGIPAVRLEDELSFQEQLLQEYYCYTSFQMQSRSERGEMESQLDSECIYRHLNHRKNWHDAEYALTMSVKAALRERGKEAMPVIMKELQQMLDRGVWHPVMYDTLSRAQKTGIIRSSMFLKDKYHASGAFDKFKARLVAGGDQQDKELYDSLSSPTVATQLVLTIAAIAAKEGRIVETADIPGAFLNASMPATGIKVLMKLDRLMTSILLKIAPEYLPFVTADGTIVVQLDKALYGCVESAKLWHDLLCKQLAEYGFKQNSYDHCVFNRGEGDDQMTVAVHVDDLLISCKSQKTIDEFLVHMSTLYKDELTRHKGTRVDYVGMTFDFGVKGKVSVSMSNMVSDLLRDCEHIGKRTTPAANDLFEVNDAPKLSAEDAKWFHTKTAQALYLAKRARPDCLTAVAFLTTRVQSPDRDDMRKLTRLLGYINGTRDRGITLQIGSTMVVRVYIDAAYGVHAESGKSHTGAMVVIGESGAVHARSTKQKIVVKSSTEAELVAVTDALGEALYIANFLRAQGYDIGPVIVHQDNMSTMALIAHGSPTSERTKHLDIRNFWMHDRVKTNCIKIVHEGTATMWANLLTKPLQGAQFNTERFGVTNWEE